jgi:hypothetical protein
VEVEVPLGPDARVTPGRAPDLCGLAFSVTATDQPVYVGLHIKVESGRYIAIDPVPDTLSGRVALARSVTWPVNLPLHRRSPYVYRILLVAGPRPLAETLSHLADSADPDPLLAKLQAEGLTVLTLHHRVDG